MPKTAPRTEIVQITPAALPAAQAAAYIGVSPKTLTNWRSDGMGPPYIRHGAPGARVSYLVKDLDAYLASNRIGSAA
jgi:hypothetical protein